MSFCADISPLAGGHLVEVGGLSTVFVPAGTETGSQELPATDQAEQVNHVTEDLMSGLGAKSGLRTEHPLKTTMLVQRGFVPGAVAVGQEGSSLSTTCARQL